MSERNSIIEIVRQDLEGKNVSPAILENVPSYVRRAVIKLQSREILPPKRFEFNSLTQKQEKRDSNGELMYYFYYLPEDFRTLKEFYVRDVESNNPLNVVPYTYYSYDNYMSVYQTLQNQNSSQSNVKIFTITDLNDNGENNRKILICVPFPDNDKHVELKYYPDGVDTNLDYFSPRHWEAIIEQVHIILGLKSAQDEENTLDEVSSVKNQKGNNNINATNTKRAVSSIFSGKSVGLNKRKRRR